MNKITPKPTDPAGVSEMGLEWSEDGYSLRTPFDGDVDGDGRHIVVGGEIVVTFADSDEGDKARERFAAVLRTPPVLGVAKEALEEIANAFRVGSRDMLIDRAAAALQSIGAGQHG